MGCCGTKEKKKTDRDKGAKFDRSEKKLKDGRSSRKSKVDNKRANERSKRSVQSGKRPSQSSERISSQQSNLSYDSTSIDSRTSSRVASTMTNKSRKSTSKVTSRRCSNKISSGPRKRSCQGAAIGSRALSKRRSSLLLHSSSIISKSSTEGRSRRSSVSRRKSLQLKNAQMDATGTEIDAIQSSAKTTNGIQVVQEHIKSDKYRSPLRRSSIMNCQMARSTNSIDPNKVKQIHEMIVKKESYKPIPPCSTLNQWFSNLQNKVKMKEDQMKQENKVPQLCPKSHGPYTRFVPSGVTVSIHQANHRFHRTLPGNFKPPQWIPVTDQEFKDNESGLLLSEESIETSEELHKID